MRTLINFPLKNYGNDDVIEKINFFVSELKQFLEFNDGKISIQNKNRKELNEITEAIIDYCDIFLEKISDIHRADNVLVKIIVELQKETYLLSLLNYNKQGILSKWHFFQNLFISENKFKEFLILKPEYWNEKYHKGMIRVPQWLKNSDNLSSLREIKAKSHGILYNEKIQELCIKKGKIFCKGELFDNFHKFNRFRKEDGDLFILDKNNHLLILETESLILETESNDKYIRHSSISRGDPVNFAGNIVIRQGMLFAIDCLSGHYRPKKKNVLNCLDYLYQKGLSLEQALVRPSILDAHYNAADFLKNNGNTDKLTIIEYTKALPSKEKIFFNKEIEENSPTKIRERMQTRAKQISEKQKLIEKNNIPTNDAQESVFKKT